MATKFVSIILPCYNEAGHLENSVNLLMEESKKFNFDFEFIFVEDKSTDNTREVLKKLEPQLQRSKFIYHEVNKGRGAAVKTGFAAAQGDIIGFIDIDLEIGPRYIPQFIEALSKHEVAIANRKYYSDSVIRALIRDTLSNYYKNLNKRILKHSYSDTEAGYKFFRREAVADFFKLDTNDHWFWDTEFVMYCFNKKLDVTEIDVEFLRDNNKKSTVNVVFDSIHYLKELRKYKNRPKD
jgi:glycosyltransferase involved in cell wall biosynthesis